jgi:aldehyde dehydrogenase (NAD+)
MQIKSIFDKMDYGSAPESALEAQNWLKKHKYNFGNFINGKWKSCEDHFDTINPANDEILAKIGQSSPTDIDYAVKAAKAAQKKWSKENDHKRARILYAIARLLQKNSRLFAVLETLDNGKPIRESRDIDIPLAQRHFYYHAGMAQLMQAELPTRSPIGICGQIIPWNFPLLMLSWKIAPAIAMGNAVILKPAEYTSLTALLFAEMCVTAGVPKGLINIVTGDGKVGEMIVSHKDIDKIAFTGSTEVGKLIRERTAGSGKSLTLELGGKSPFIVFDDADLDSAVEGVVDAIWFNQGQVCCAGSRLLVHEAIAEQFYGKLKARMKNLRLGDPLDKSIDMGAIIDKKQHKKITQMVSQTNGKVYQAKSTIPEKGCFFPPTLITDLHTADPLMQEEIFGPILVCTTFRTPSEAIELSNNTTFGLAASIWTENINLCLELAPKIKAGVIWINGTNMFDAAAGFGGLKQSGFGREGGWEGLLAYTKPKKYSSKSNKTKTIKKQRIKDDYIDRTAKLYIGGKQCRPDSGYSQSIFDHEGKPLTQVPLSTRKDIRNAVEAMNSAQAWSHSTAHLRAQILYYMAENLSARKAEFVKTLQTLTGSSGSENEVEFSIQRLFFYAAWADKFDGSARNVPVKAIALVMNEPIGNCGVICDDKYPLLGFISAMAPLFATGNRSIIIPSELFSPVVTDFYQVLDTSDVPPGSVNIITGKHNDLALEMASHMDIESLWSFSTSDISKDIERASSSNLKRTWVNNGFTRDWYSEEGFGKEFLINSTENKTIWIPYGE